MRTFHMFVIAFAAFAIVGCETRKEEIRIDNVVRVFMHEPHRFSLLAQPAGSMELVTHAPLIPYGALRRNPNGEVVRCGTHLRTDAPNGEPMWATIERWNNTNCVFTIHLHDPTDIEGGWWNHGKHGRGTTQVVE